MEQWAQYCAPPRKRTVSPPRKAERRAEHAFGLAYPCAHPFLWRPRPRLGEAAPCHGAAPERSSSTSGKGQAGAIAAVYGDAVHPADLYDEFGGYSRGDLQEWTAGIGPPKRGRPRRWPEDADARIVAAVNRVRREHGYSEWSACAAVARRWKVSCSVLRMRYRRAIKR